MVMLLRKRYAVCSCGVNAKMSKHLTAKGAGKRSGRSCWPSVKWLSCLTYEIKLLVRERGSLSLEHQHTHTSGQKSQEPSYTCGFVLHVRECEMPRCRGGHRKMPVSVHQQQQVGVGWGFKQATCQQPGDKVGRAGKLQQPVEQTYLPVPLRLCWW